MPIKVCKAAANRICHVTQMIHGRLVPNSHPIVPSAKLKLRKALLFITGHRHVKCFAPVVVMHRTGSFSLL